MPRDHHVVATEMLETMNGIEAAIANHTFEEYKSDWVLRRAIERGLEIISEASRHPPTRWMDQHPAIPWSKVRSLGNILLHEYHTIVDRVLWNICEDNLPKLKQAVEAMVATADKS